MALNSLGRFLFPPVRNCNLPRLYECNAILLLASPPATPTQPAPPPTKYTISLQELAKSGNLSREKCTVNGMMPGQSAERVMVYLVEKILEVVIGSLVRQTRNQSLCLLRVVTAKGAWQRKPPLSTNISLDGKVSTDHIPNCARSNDDRSF